MEGHRVMMEGQMQVPVAAQPPDQPPGLLSASQIPPTASQRMQVKGHPPVMGGGGYGQQHEGLAYCPPMDYMQQRHHPSQPCHIVGKPYYGQAQYHGQQMLINPHVSPPAGQHQSIYFRPGRGGSTGAYPKVQGSSHGWGGDYRVKLDQMQMYGPNQQYTNPTLYVNPTPVDPRITEFGSPMGVPAALEGQRFGSPTHGYPSGPGYYGGGQPIQQYPPYMVPGKPWHSGTEHGIQRTVVDPQYKAVHPVNNVGDPGFPRHPGALSPAAVGASKLPQNYIPGKRLEHFSPGMQGCGGGGGPVMMSPSRQNPECLEEFPGAKTPMVIHGSGHPVEFPNRHCVVYGPMLSPGSQYRPGVSQRNVDIGGLHQGVYGSNVYGQQQQGFVDGPTTPRCHYSSYPKQLQSPHFYPYTSTKCESEGVVQFYGGQEPTVGASSTAAASVGQNQICREPMAYHNLNPEMAENAGSTTSHLHPGQSVATSCDAMATFTSASTRRSSDVLSPSLERTSSSVSGVRIDEQRRLSNLQTSSISTASCLYSSSANAEMGLVKSSPVSMSANFPSGCSVVSDALTSLGNTKETVFCFDNLQPSTSALARTDVGRSPVSAASAAKSLPLSNYPMSYPAKTNLETSCAVVTQTVSTSTTVAMTVSTAASVSRHCSLVTAAVEVSGSQSGKEFSSSSPCYRGESRAWPSKLSSDKSVDFKEFSNAVALPPSLHSSVPASPVEIQEVGVQQVKMEPMFASPRSRVPRAKKKKVKLKNVVEFPKPESGVTSIKLEEPGEVVCVSPVTDNSMCKDASSLFAARPRQGYMTKEQCLEDSALTNRDLPLPKDHSTTDPAPCLEKVEVGDVKEHVVKSSVTVPFGWKRLNKDGRVVYHSPTDIELESLDQIRQYLLKEGTCKCGLQCPLVAEKVFVFDPAAESRHLCADDVRCDMDMTNLCNHKRKIVAMATFQHSAGLQMNLIDGMQFRGSMSSSGATPLRSASVGFEGRTEFGSTVGQSSDAFAGKFSHAGSESLATSNQKIPQGCFPGNPSAFGRNPVRADGQSIDDDGFCAMESNKWPPMLSPGGVAHGKKPMSMVENSGPPGNSSYLSHNCGLQAGAPRGTMEHQHLDLSTTPPRHGNPNQHPGGFPMESPGYRVMQGMGPQHSGPSGYGPSRPMWPPYEETRFPSSQYGRQGMYGLQMQSKFRGSGEMMWPFRQPVHGGRVGPPHMAQPPFSGYAMTPEEQNDMAVGRGYDVEGHAMSELWGQSTTVAPGTKSVRKARKKVSKKEKPYSSILEKSMPCPNIDVRQIIQEQQERIQVEASASHGCQLPTGPGTDHLATFLAQQTVLVNRSLPGNLGCASPADDSDATQSASTIYGSVDDVASCQTGSSPLVDNSSVSLSVTPSTSGQTEKKSCDEGGEAKVRTFSLSADTSMDSASHSSVFSSCQLIATENVSPSSEQSTVLASPTGQSGSSEQQPSMATCSAVAGRGFAQSAAESTLGNVDRGVVSSFCSSSDQSNVHLGPGMPSFQLRPTLTQGSATHGGISNVSDLGILTHQPPMFSFNSNSSHAGFHPNWSSSNPVHSRNQFYFPPRQAVPFTSAVPGVTNRNVLLLGPQEMSSSCRSEQYVAHLTSGVDVGLVPDNHAVMKPALSSLSSGAGTQMTEPFAHVPFDAAAGGVPMLQRCPAVSQESRFLEEPGPGCLAKEQSPITLVQNMVSGLVTTQNTLAMVTSMIISRSDTSRRRKSGTYTDPTARKPLSQGIASAAVAVTSNVCTDAVVSSSESSTVACSSPLRAESSCSRNAYVEMVNQSPASMHSMAETPVVSGFHVVSQEQVAMAAATAVTTVTQVVPTAGIQPSFGPIVQVLNPVNITLPGTSILLNDQVNVLAFGGQDPTILQQGLTMPGVGQLHLAPHQPQGQMVVFPTGQGTAMVAIQPSQSTLVTDFAMDDGNHAGGSGLVEEEEAGVVEEGDEGEQMEADEMMRTTGTQTSTPASSFSNCNSLDSGENELEVTEVLCPDQSVSSSTKEDAGVVPATKDGAGIRRAVRKATQPTMASILQQQQQQGQISTAQVVVMPSVQQQPFVLPQGVAFAGALGGQGYLQLQQPVDFGFSPNQVGLIHFGQITAAGGLIPTTALVGAMSVAGGGVMSSLDRVMAPDMPVCAPNQPAKSDPGQTFGAAEILHLMSPSMPHGPILVQNMPTFAPFAGTLLPVMPQAALGTAICNIGGAQTIFAVSQGSLGIVTTVASALQHPPPDRMFGDAMPEAPDSTVDSEDAISSNVVDADSVVTSTDAHHMTFISTEPCSSRDRPRSTNSLCQTRPSSAVVDVAAEDPRDVKDENSETPKESPEFTRETESHSPTAMQRQVPDDGTSRESESSTQNSKDSPLVQAGPSFGFTGEQLKGTTPMKLVRHRKTKKMKRKRHLPSSFSSHSSTILVAPSELEFQDTAKLSSDFEKRVEKVASPGSSAGVESGDNAIAASKREAESNKDDLSTDVISKSGSSMQTGFVATSAECHVTTSLSCDSGDSSTCNTEKPSYNRASRLRTKLERARSEHLSFPKGRHALKRAHEDDTSKDRRLTDDADSTTSLPSISYPRSFNVGDLVWGPARGFPSWPGKLVPETEVRGNPKTENGKIWVKWFGDHTFTQADPDQLKTLSEGLETHHNARKKHRKGRRMNANLEAAIQEAMGELDRQAEQDKQTFGSSTPSDKSTPAKQWSSKRTKK